MKTLAGTDQGDFPDSQSDTEPEETEMPIHDNELDDRLASLLRELLEQERRRIARAAEDKCNELRSFISVREDTLSDNSKIDKLFYKHLETIPTNQKPEGWSKTVDLFNEWKNTLRAELTDKKMSWEIWKVTLWINKKRSMAFEIGYYLL